METQTVTAAPVINSAKRATITRVYSGQAGKCCCGCKGTYSTSAARISRVVNLINANSANAEVDSSYIAVEIGYRQHIAYFD